MAAHRQKCHDWRLFIAAAAPSAPTSQIFAQVRAEYSDEFSSHKPRLARPKVAIRDTTPPRSLPARCERPLHRPPQTHPIRLIPVIPPLWTTTRSTS